VLYPEAGLSKGHVIDYYTRVAPVLLPHLRMRPLTLKRYPNGIHGEHFYEKRCPSHRPEWVQTVEVYSGRAGGIIPFCLANDLPTLVWLANLADLELHTSLSRAPEIERPTVMAFDLDPGPPADVLDCARVALMLQELFAAQGLDAYPKTSGSKGLQVYVPLNTAATYDETKPFARAVAELLEQRDPRRITSRMTKTLRPGKVFIDWSQNDEHKTTISVYSLRAHPLATASTPVSWDEVAAAADGGEPADLAFTHAQVLDRVARLGDLFAPVAEQQQTLPSFARR
jgi:bifunctional non-homologous end joining protein LigD